MHSEGEFQSFYTSNGGYLAPPSNHAYPYPIHQNTFPRDNYTDLNNQGRVKMSQPPVPNGRPAPQQMEIEDLEPIYIESNSHVDTEPSNDFEENSSRVLERLLTKELEVYETEEQKQNKEMVLIRLNEILLKWMDIVKRKHGLRPDPRSGNAILLCYGSYKLGVSSPSGDIDTLILAPYYVDRNDDFFGELYPLLMELSKSNPNIQEVNMVNQQHTIMPLIKMSFYSIPIDMVFANVQFSGELSDFVKSNLDDEEYMLRMDEKMKGSYNGFRNAEMLLKSLKLASESQMLTLKREEVFRITLKCIKLWAKNNGLDSNKMGYLGGIAWAILTAKICKLYPYKCPSKLLERFFWLFGSEWKWDEWTVRIVEKTEEKTSFRHNIRSMYIMTPARPQANTTYNVTVSNREIITSRMMQAHRTVSDLLKRQSQVQSLPAEDPTAKSEWQVLFNKFNFFESYEHFIEISILGSKECDYLRWQGFVEAKIRILCEKLEELTRIYDLKIHPWPSSYDRDHNTFPGFPSATTIYIGLKIVSELDDCVDLNIPIFRYLEFLDYEWDRDNPKRDPKMYNLSITYKLRDEIPKEVLRAESGEVDPTEPKELMLSAHKSAIKDDMNQDAGEVEDEETFSKASQAILNGSEFSGIRSPFQSFKYFEHNQVLKNAEGKVDAYGYFDLALISYKKENNMDEEIMLQKRPKSFHVPETTGEAENQASMIFPSGPDSTEAENNGDLLNDLLE